MHQHQFAAFQGSEIQRAAVQAQVFAVDAQVLAACRGRLGRVAGQGQLLVQRCVARVADGQGRGQLAAIQLEAGLGIAQLEGEGAAVERSSPGRLGLGQQAAPGQVQGVALLGRQPLLAGDLVGQGEQALFATAGGQVVLLQHGEDQRLIAQRTAVVAQPASIVAAARQAGGQGSVGARLIAHFLQGHGQVHQRQAGLGIVAALIQAAQGAERCLLAARQHVSGIGLHGEAAVLGGVAVVDLDQVALLHIAQQPFAGLVQRLGRHAEALLAGAQEEVADIGAQPVFLVAIGAPQGETAVVPLHAEQALDAQFDGAPTLCVRLGFQPQFLQCRGIGIQ
ncbi:hypothetical protein D9M68_661020 [compost metagenome]